ncbi:MAG: Endolytic murein transglycosylase [Parcubacteria group bacterium]|nr:Endolytic murein transglycosylase [Parcubacteria group bacterium]
MIRAFVRTAHRSWKRTLRYLIIGTVIFLILFVLAYAHFFGPVQKQALAEQFIVTPGSTTEQVISQLKTEGYVRSSWALRIALLEKAQGKSVRAGGYSISKSMDTWTVAKTLVGPPQLVFVTFPPAIRKEQMGEILAGALNWSPGEKEQWNTTATEPDPNFIEGVYYPDTYLIPSDQTPAQVAARMRGRFTDVFAPYAKEAQQKGVKWTDVLTLASIVDREAGKNDKALVAGILLNRLDTGMRLQADATLQYIKGAQGNWWPQPTSADKYLESAFNTYQHSGLPPHPIDNPSLESIAAVLNPDDTNCLFYLHDDSHDIHCSLTYAGQKSNVNKYLK